MPEATRTNSSDRIAKIASVCFIASTLLPVLFTPGFSGDKQRDEKSIENANRVQNILVGWTILGWLIALGWAAGCRVALERPTQ